MSDVPAAQNVVVKRERSSKACVSCHNKKIKCNLDKVPDNTKCHNCQTSGAECTLYVRKKRATTKFSSLDRNTTAFPSTNKKRQLVSDESLIDSKSGSLGNDISRTSNSSNNSKNIFSSNNSTRNSDSTPSTTPNSYPQHKHSILNSNFSSLDSHSDVKYTSSIPKFPTSFLNPSKHSRYHHLSSIALDPNVILKENMQDLMMTEFGMNGESNTLMKQIFNKALDKITEDHKRSYTLDSLDLEVLQSFGCFNIPDEITCWKYIDNFFEFINPQLPIVDKTNFYENYTDLRNPPSLLLLFSILYVGAWHANSESNDPQRQAENVEISQILFKRATLLYQYSIETEPIALIQSLLCFSFHNGNMSNIAKNSYYWCHAAVNVCYQYGLHLNPPSDSSSYQKKIRKRLWWILYFKDRLTGFGYSRPSIINLNQSDHSMLSLRDLSGTGMTPLESLYLINLVKFGKLIDKIAALQQEITKLYLDGKQTLHLIKKCDLIMIKYLNNIPKELKFKFNDKSTHSFLSLMILSQYYTLLIVIHKANILRHATDVYPSWAISFQAVQIIKMMSDCLVAKNLISKVAFVSHNSLTTSALIMSYHLINEDPKISKIAKDTFLRIMGIWRQSYRKFPNCYPMLCIFATIYDSEDYLKQIVKSVVPHNLSSPSRIKVKHKQKNKVKTESQPNEKTETVNSNTETSNEPTNNYSADSENSTTNEEKLEEKKKLNLPDLSLLATGEFDMKNLPFNSSFSNFEHLGVDFDKLFTESVFTNGDHLLPKLDLESIGNPKPISLESNLQNMNKKIKIENDDVVLKSPFPTQDTNGNVPYQSPSKNKTSNESQNTTNNLSESITDSFLEFKDLNFSNTPDLNLDSNNPIVPDSNIPISLWMMKTNWQPKFNLERSDSSFEKTTPQDNMNSKGYNDESTDNNNDNNNNNDTPESYFPEILNENNLNHSYKRFSNQDNSRAENIYYANTYQIMGGIPRHENDNYNNEVDYNTMNRITSRDFDNIEYKGNVNSFPHVYANNDKWFNKPQQMMNAMPNNNIHVANPYERELPDQRPGPYYDSNNDNHSSSSDKTKISETKKFNSYYNQTPNLNQMVHLSQLKNIHDPNTLNIPYNGASPYPQRQWISAQPDSTSYYNNNNHVTYQLESMINPTFGPIQENKNVLNTNNNNQHANYENNPNQTLNNAHMYDHNFNN